MNEIHTIPLFPLGVNIVPTMRLPLHIFEDRYKLMISECIREDKPFGIVLFDGHQLRGVGCTARVVKVIKQYEDGRMDIVTKGEDRFAIQKVIEEKPYMEAFVNTVEDTDEPDPGSMQEFRPKLAEILNELSALDPSSYDLQMLEQTNPGNLSFSIAAAEGFTPAERQVLLEMTSAEKRIEKGLQALSKLAQRIRLGLEIKRIIGGNGRPAEGLLGGLSNDFDI